MSGRFSQEDLDALEMARETGQWRPASRRVDEVPNVIDDQPFQPTVFPAELRGCKMTRSGDWEIVFVLPNRWRSAIQDVGMAARKRLMVTLEEWNPDLIEEIVMVD